MNTTTLGRVLALALLSHGVIAGPLLGHDWDAHADTRSAPAPAPAPTPTPRPRLHGRFLHITDIHPDEYYKVHSSTDEDGACHRGRGPAGAFGAETSDCDSPFSLVNATFDWIAANLRDSVDFVIWTGDSARHDRDEGLPRHAEQVLGANTQIADRFAAAFAARDADDDADDDADAAPGLAVPIVPTFGNNDILPHNILLPGPNKWFQHYAHIWRHFIPEEQRHSFEFGGWFHVEVIPDRLAVFSLNTLYFFDRNAGVDGCADPAEPGYKQLEWLAVQLQFLRARGMKAILMGHVPPARTESKTLWDETCWQKYSLWVHQFRDVVVAGLYGHMNIDHFLIHDVDDVDIDALLAGGAAQSDAGVATPRRQAMQGELSVQSASEYLAELRSDWAKLKPPPTPGGKNISEEEEEEPKNNKKKKKKKKGKGNKGKKRKDPWGERYHLTLVSPSVVPTYFPTLRVIEYNITGLEDALTWKEVQDANETKARPSASKHLDLRHLSSPETESQLGISDDDDTASTTTKDKDGSKDGGDDKPNNNKKKKKDPPTRDPNLHIPPPPSKSAPPGPAYSPQPLTLTGYTQFFANLTHINNLTLTTDPDSDSHDGNEPEADEEETGRWDWLLPLRWRKGKHGGKKPVTGPHQPPPEPREFAFDVEYSTFEDEVYRLRDLRVGSYVELAVRIGETVGGKVAGEGWEWDGEEGGEDDGGKDDRDGEEEEEDGSQEEDENSDDDDDNEEEAHTQKKGKGNKGKKGGKGNKGKKGKKGRKRNKTWLHFLKHAFVETLDKDELKKIA